MVVVGADQLHFGDGHHDLLLGDVTAAAAAAPRSVDAGAARDGDAFDHRRVAGGVHQKLSLFDR